jgi:hypothetical protein
MAVMWEIIVVWSVVVAVGFFCLRWAYKTLFGQKGGGCGCSSAGCPLRQDGSCQGPPEDPR